LLTYKKEKDEKMLKVIEVKGLVKRYQDVVAVNEISFDVYRNEIFSLVGPNAAGKTTTVEILECLRKPTSGSAKVLGFDVVEDEHEIKRKIGVMPQDFNAFDRLTVIENVELIAKIYGTREEVRRNLEALDLWEAKDKRFYTLSGGMKRRVGICMALVSNPELLFLDEPTTGLDPQARKECWEVIKNLKKMGKTVFLTTHYMEEAEKLSDKVGVIVKGKIVAIDNARALISKYGGDIKIVIEGRKEELLRKFTKNVSFEDGKTIGKFQTRREANRALSFLYGKEYSVEVIEPGMEDVFLRLAGGKIDERGELV
jgi:ABC-2 type transport system ATP-binding protein